MLFPNDPFEMIYYVICQRKKGPKILSALKLCFAVEWYVYHVPEAHTMNRYSFPETGNEILVRGV